MVMLSVIIIGYVWLQPVIPYLRAKLQKRDIVIMIGKDSKVRLIPAKYSSGVYTTSTPPYSFIQRQPIAYRFGELNAVFVHDGWGVVVDPDMAEAARVLADNGITTYEKLEKSLNEGTVKDADKIRLHAFKDVDFHSLLNYVGDVTPTQVRAHIDEMLASYIEEYKNLGEKSSGGNMMIIVILLVVAIGGFFVMKGMGMF
ncbi:MAG: hypothetical protein PHR28_13090 [candidate division Zixibacteria bacterium]|nr:hypothetical protein [candidate division Zixibacteria bacterium]